MLKVMIQDSDYYGCEKLSEHNDFISAMEAIYAFIDSTLKTQNKVKSVLAGKTSVTVITNKRQFTLFIA